MRQIGSILIGAESIIIPFVQARVPYVEEGFGPCSAIGVVRDGKIIGGVVYHQYRERDGDIMVSLAFDRPHWALPYTLRMLFTYPFVTLGCERITAAIPRSNARSRRICERLGFKLEGVCRKAFGRKEDAMLYGILRSECRYLDGQKNSTASRAA